MITPEEGDGQQATGPEALQGDEMEQLQAIVNDAFGVKPKAEEPVEEAVDDREEVEFDGEKIPLTREELRQYARDGFLTHKEKAALAKEKEALREMAERLQNADAMTSGLMQFLGDERNAAQAQMIANIVRGRPITDGVNLHPYDARQLGLAQQEAAPQPRRRQREEEVEEEEAEQDDDDLLSVPQPRRSQRNAKPQTDPQLLKVLEGLGAQMRSFQERQDQIDAAIRAQREAEQQKAHQAQVQAFHDRIETAILGSPLLRKLGMKDAKEFVVAKMRSSGTRDPKLVVEYANKALSKLANSERSDAVKTRGKTEAAHAAVPKGGSVPTERMKSAGAAMPPLGTPEFVDRALEALASGQ